MSWPEVMTKLFWAMGGALCSGLTAYIVLGRQVAYVKGRLENVIDAVHDHHTLKERHIVLAEDYAHHKNLDAGRAHPSSVSRPASSLPATSLQG